jgi:fused signal recognition particle receptor
MRRWFRRKGKEEERRKKEAAEASRPEAPESSSEAAEDLAPPAEDFAAPEPEAQEATPPGVETGAAPEPRRGLFCRGRRGLPEEEAAPAALEDAADASEEAVGVDLTPPPREPERPPEPPPFPEPEPPPVAPLLPDPGLETAPPGAGEEETSAEIPKSEALEEPGEVSEVVRRKRFQRLRERLKRTREALSGGLDRVFRGRKVIDAALLEDLEELLITADLGVETSLLLIQALQEKLKRRELREVEQLKAALQAEMVALLTGPAPRERRARPWVVLLVGVNGVGKTTTIAKLAYRDRHRGLTPLLVAADTFRAAAVEQLEIWGERAGAAVVKQKTGADPAAVVFDGLTAASARGADTVYVDTAGRLHTKVNLMEELKKIHRTAAKKIPGAPHEVFLVLDATTGQNALNQARLFHEAVGLTGLILTKMDGTAKGGVALAVVHETGIPLRYIGVGEAMEDLRPFDAAAFVEAILG